MDKQSLFDSFMITVTAIGAAVAGYAGMRQVAILQNGPDPTFDVRTQPSRRWVGWHELTVTAINANQRPAMITSVRVRKPRRSKIAYFEGGGADFASLAIEWHWQDGVRSRESILNIRKLQN